MMFQPGDEMVSTGEAGPELQAAAPGPRKNWAKTQVPNRALNPLWRLLRSQQRDSLTA